MTKKEKVIIAAPKVSIVILNWNGKYLLKSCLDSIKQNTKYKCYEIIVVDQGSKDGSMQMLKQYPDVKVICNKTNVGIPRGTNQGIATATGELIMLLSNDTIVTSGWLHPLVRNMYSKKVAVVGSSLIHPTELKEYYWLPTMSKTKKRASVCSAAMMLKKSVWDKIGGYDERNFTPYGGEETDWNLRAWNRGYVVLEEEYSVVAHYGSVNTAMQNPNQYLLLNKGRLRAMLYNQSAFGLLKRSLGMGLVFIDSIRIGKTHILLRAYFEILQEWKTIMHERGRRNDEKKEGLNANNK